MGEIDTELRFGKAVRAARVALDWSQAELRLQLSDEYGIDLSKTAMSRLENGERPVRLSEALALSALLGFNLSTLAVEVDLVQVEIRATERRLRAAKREAAQLCTRLDELRASAGGEH